MHTLAYGHKDIPAHVLDDDGDRETRVILTNQEACARGLGSRYIYRSRRSERVQTRRQPTLAESALRMMGMIESDEEDQGEEEDDDDEDMENDIDSSSTRSNNPFILSGCSVSRKRTVAPTYSALSISHSHNSSRAQQSKRHRISSDSD